PQWKARLPDQDRPGKGLGHLIADRQLGVGNPCQGDVAQDVIKAAAAKPVVAEQLVGPVQEVDQHHLQKQQPQRPGIDFYCPLPAAPAPPQPAIQRPGCPTGTEYQVEQDDAADHVASVVDGL